MLLASIKCDFAICSSIQNYICRDGKLDAYLGDYPILDYARAKLDPNCQLKLVGQTYGEDGYGIGLPKNSTIRVSISIIVANIFYHTQIIRI